MMTLKDYIQCAHDNAMEKGFWDKRQHIGTLLMLIVSELGEALEAHRKRRRVNIGHYPWKDTDTFEQNIKDTFEDEIADVFIRLFDMCGGLGINIEEHIRQKMKYNRTRPRLHGKSY